MILQTSVPQGIAGNLLWGLEPACNPTNSKIFDREKEYIYWGKDQSTYNFIPIHVQVFKLSKTLRKALIFFTEQNFIHNVFLVCINYNRLSYTIMIL